MAMLCSRTTPIDSSLPSPGELLQSHQLHGNVPTVIHNTNPQQDNIYDRLHYRQLESQANHDRREVQELPPLLAGQKVSVQSPVDHKWTPGTITNNRSEPRSYDVATPDGRIARRNRSHLRERAEQGAKKLETDKSNIVPSVPTASIPVKPPEFTAQSQPALRRSERTTKAPERLIESA